MEAILWDFAAFQRTRQFHISQGILLFDTAEGNLNLEFRREPIFILYYDIVLSDIVNIWGHLQEMTLSFRNVWSAAAGRHRSETN